MPEHLTIGMVVDNEFYGDHRVYNEAKVLVQAGYTVKVLCLNFGSYPDREVVDGIEVVRVRIALKKKKRLSALMLTLPFYRWFWRKAIHQFILTEQIEVLHVHNLYMARMAKEGISRNYVRLILDLHGDYSAAIMGYDWATHFPARLIVRPWLWKKLEEQYLGFANKIILINNDFKKDILTRFPYLNEKNLVVYPNVSDPANEDSTTVASQTGEPYIHHAESIQQMEPNGQQTVLSEYNACASHEDLDALYSEFLLNK